MPAKIIAIANQKGGVGKTTTTICLAQELIRRKKKVLVIDTDSQCNATGFYEAETSGVPTFYDILVNETPAVECIQHTEKGDIIPADPLLKEAESAVRQNERRYKHLLRSCRDISNKYEWILCDTGPVIGVGLKNVLAYAQSIIIPIEESAWALNGLMDFSDAIDLAQDDNPNLSVVGILTVKAKERTRKSARIGSLAQTIAEQLKTKCFRTKIRESVSCPEALTEYLLPLHLYAPKSTTCEDYKAFTDELLKEIKINNGNSRS